MFRDLTEAYRWTPEEIGKLTYYQARMYMCKKAELGGTVSMTVAEAQEAGIGGLTEGDMSIEEKYSDATPTTRRSRRPVRRRRRK
jgi:hypothetical protein